MTPNEIGLMLRVGEDPAESLRKVASLGLSLVQLGYPGDAWLAEPKRAQLKRMLDDARVRVFTVFIAFAGEDYADIPTIRRTVGYLDPATRADRVARTVEACEFAKALGALYIHMHVGFIPVDPAHPQYAPLVDALKRIADGAAAHALGVALETGQEPADVLVRFIGDIGRANIRVNFDPANMILYRSGDPHDALAKLAPWIVSIHCKDARPTTEKDKLGEETPLGEGAVDYPRLIRGLKAIGFTGPLIIEREISGPEQVRDVRAAIEIITRLLGA